MKEDRSYNCCHKPPVVINVPFTLESLKEYYKTIKGRPDIPSNYLLMIANKIIENS